MARMSDEQYTFIQDIKDKKSIARSARHTRSHCGKGGRVRLPSDILTAKELKAMNSECNILRPLSGSVSFEGHLDDILSSIADFIQDGCVKMIVSWEVIPERSEVVENPEKSNG